MAFTKQGYLWCLSQIYFLGMVFLGYVRNHANRVLYIQRPQTEKRQTFVSNPTTRQTFVPLSDGVLSDGLRVHAVIANDL